MAKSKNKSTENWWNNWQQQWTEVMKGYTGNQSELQDNFKQFTSAWNASSDNQQDSYDHFLDASKQFFAFGESWLSSLSNVFENDDAIPDASAFTAQMMNEWQKILGKNLAMDHEMFQTPIISQLFRQFGVEFPNQWQPWFNQTKTAPNFSQLFNLPGIGPFQQDQAVNQEQAKASFELQQAYRQIAVILNQSSQQAITLLQTKLLEKTENNQHIKSMREFYDLWIDCAEAAFAETAFSDDYREAYGDLVNKMMRVKQNIHQQVHKTCSQYGIVTQQELQSVVQQLAKLRKQSRQLQQELNETKQANQKLQQQLAATDKINKLSTKRAPASKTKTKVKATKKQTNVKKTSK